MNRLGLSLIGILLLQSAKVSLILLLSALLHNDSRQAWLQAGLLGAGLALGVLCLTYANPAPHDPAH